MAWTAPDQVSRNTAAALMKMALILTGGGDVFVELTATEKNRIKTMVKLL
jgi:hypothetical protein